MIYNIITFKDGSRKKCDGDLTISQIKAACEAAGIEIKGVERMGLVEKSEEDAQKLYYKVIWGFEDERITSIEEKDLVKALYAMSTKSKVYLGDVLLDGKYIIAIKEDFHRAMGWNFTHEIDGDDWNKIRESGVERLYVGKLHEAKEKVQGIIKDKNIGQLVGDKRQLN